MTLSVPERRRGQRVAVGTSSWLALPTSWSVELIDVGIAGLSFSSSHALNVGRTVYVTTCVAAFRTYHAWIEDENLLISAASIGEGSFGELLMNGLRIR